MPEKLHSHIQHLHDELKNAAVDDITANSLKEMADDIKLSVAQAEGKIPDQSFMDELERHAIELSETHPTVSNVLRQIIVSLGSMGI